MPTDDGTPDSAEPVEAKRVGRIQSVTRALAIMDAIATNKAMRAQEIASETQLNLTTAVHLLNTLTDGGYLAKHGRSYSLSTEKVLWLYSQVQADVRPSPAVLEALNRVTQATGESGYVSCWTGDDVMIVAVAEGSHAVRVAGLQVGLAGDIHARSSGKCLLAFAPEGRAERVLARGPLRRRTPSTIVDADAMREELAAIRQRGYSIDREEYLEGVWGIAVPLRLGERYPHCALTITMPAARFHANEAGCTKVLLDAAAAVGQGSGRE
jgi:DNA-binding IclR family transcriptional regulator